MRMSDWSSDVCSSDLVAKFGIKGKQLDVCATCALGKRLEGNPASVIVITRNVEAPQSIRNCDRCEMRCRQARDHRHCRQDLADSEQCFQPLAKYPHRSGTPESDARPEPVPPGPARHGDR